MNLSGQINRQLLMIVGTKPRNQCVACVCSCSVVIRSKRFRCKMARLALVGSSHHANILIARLIDIDISISQSMLNIDLRSTRALQIDGQATLETAYFGSEGSGSVFK
jgi:hypothetical protein